jgi:hypothetical protein
MPIWNVHTFSGSAYQFRRRGAAWSLVVLTPPSSTRIRDLRGARVPIVMPAPWPPRLGASLYFVYVLPGGALKLRRTSAVLRFESIEGEHHA